MDYNKLVEDYEKAVQEVDRLDKELGNYFMPLAFEAKKKGDLPAIRSLIEKCPDSVTRVFLLDIQRQLQFVY